MVINIPCLLSPEGYRQIPLPPITPIPNEPNFVLFFFLVLFSILFALYIRYDKEVHAYIRYYRDRWVGKNGGGGKRDR